MLPFDSSIETADLEFLRVSCAGNPPYESGTTALSVLLSDRCMYIANVGDCRAVLCRAGKAIELTRDHKANSHEEKARIERNGGLVQFDMLNGHLAVSRALGGYDSESNSKIKGLTSEPDLFKLFLTEDDEFLILASDGLWDSFDSETVVRISRDSLLRNNDVSALTEKLLDDAISRGSEDNITIIIIGFNRYSPLTLERQIILPDFEVKRHWNHLSSPSLSKSVSNSSPDSRITKSSHCKLSTLGLNALRQALERQ